jgi:hypothetical protein
VQHECIKLKVDYGADHRLEDMSTKLSYIGARMTAELEELKKQED